MAANWQIGDIIPDSFTHKARWQIRDIKYGGMGAVYVVYDHDLRQYFAAKTFLDEVFARNPTIAERFVHEAVTWLNLDIHQNVTRACTVHNVEGRPLLFLEYVSGGDLSGWLGTPRLSDNLPQALQLAIQFCDGMIHAYSKGLKVHRDIKPQNCLITHDGMLKVTDFGLAKVFDDIPDLVRASDSTLNSKRFRIARTRTGVAAGTCTHMAPEQFDDAKSADIRADIYSFGVMLYQMITGGLPFEGHTWNEFERLHKKQPPPALRPKQINGGRKELAAIDGIIQTCLSKNRELRFPEFSTVRRQLAELYESITKKPAPQPSVGLEPGANYWISKGAALQMLGRSQEALVSYERAIALKPDSWEAWTNRGEVLWELRRSGEALGCYERALELNPRDEKAWYNKGLALGTLGKEEEALTCFGQALAIDPHFSQAWYNKGYTLAYGLRRCREAIECFEEALRLGYPHGEQQIAWCRETLRRGLSRDVARLD